MVIVFLAPALMRGEGVEGTVRASSDAAIWLEGPQGPEFLFPARACTLAGIPALKAFRPDDGVRASCTGPGPVRVCDRMESALPLTLAAEWVATLRDVQEAGPGGRLWLVDVRPEAEFRAGHLPGASPWPLSRHTPDKRPIVLYGRSERDPVPHAVLRELLDAGRPEVRVYRGGIEEWNLAGLPLSLNPAGLRTLMAAEPAIVVDVRGPGERARGAVPDAYGIPLDRMDWRMFSSALGMPSLVFVGQDGADSRPGQAAEKALKWRFGGARGMDRPVRILEGGMAAWSAAGLPMTTADLPEGINLSDHLPEGAVAPERFRAWLEAPPPDRVLVDLRAADATPRPGTLHIPLEDLPRRLAELPKDKPLVLFCAAGRRAAVGRALLHRLGYRAEYMPAPMPDL